MFIYLIVALIQLTDKSFNILELSTVAKLLPKKKRETYSWQDQQEIHTPTRMPQTPKKNERFLCFSAAKKVDHRDIPLHVTKLSEAFGDIISDPVVEWLHRGTPMVWICAASQQGYSDVTPRALAAFFDDSEGLEKDGAALSRLHFKH